jgi:DNA-binding transcriptional ArsR family regulator
MMEKAVLDTCDEACTGTGAVKEGHELPMTEDLAVGVADIFKALGDPTRVKIIFLLLKQELCVHDLSTLLSMGQSAVSHQLRYLRDTHIVKRRKVGKTVFYSLDDDHIEQIFVQTLGHLHHM